MTNTMQFIRHCQFIMLIGINRKLFLWNNPNKNTRSIDRARVSFGVIRVLHWIGNGNLYVRVRMKNEIKIGVAILL